MRDQQRDLPQIVRLSQHDHRVRADVGDDLDPAHQTGPLGECSRTTTSILPRIKVFQLRLHLAGNRVLQTENLERSLRLHRFVELVDQRVDGLEVGW